MPRSNTAKGEDQDPSFRRCIRWTHSDAPRAKFWTMWVMRAEECKLGSSQPDSVGVVAELLHISLLHWWKTTVVYLLRVVPLVLLVIPGHRPDNSVSSFSRRLLSLRQVAVLGFMLASGNVKPKLRLNLKPYNAP